MKQPVCIGAKMFQKPQNVAREICIEMLECMGAKVQDLSPNDNRSQDRSVVRNLDLLAKVGRREFLIELEARSAPKGSPRPGDCWTSREELDALVSWEQQAANRLGIVIWCFYASQPAAGFAPDRTVDGVHWMFRAAPAARCLEHMKVRCNSWGGKTTMNFARGTAPNHWQTMERAFLVSCKLSPLQKRLALLDELVD